MRGFGCADACETVTIRQQIEGTCLAEPLSGIENRSEISKKEA
jgi:hypothetical protein